MSLADTHEPAPIPNARPAVWSLVMADMQARDSEGRRKYGTPLQPFNGRDALVDAYQEALDLVVYLRQAIEERDAVREAAEHPVGSCAETNCGRLCTRCFAALDPLAARDGGGE